MILMVLEVFHHFENSIVCPGFVRLIPGDLKSKGGPRYTFSHFIFLIPHFQDCPAYFRTCGHPTREPALSRQICYKVIIC